MAAAITTKTSAAGTPIQGSHDDGPGPRQPDQASAAGRAPYRTDIQGFRALAVGLVVAYHAGLPIPGGYIGVDVFFVISGFVITQAIWSDVERTGRVSLSRFFARRVRRILPALAVLLVFVGLATPIIASFGARNVAAETGLAAALSGSNIYLYLKPSLGYFGLNAAANPLLHTWSLGVEEQFYFFFPLVVAATVWLTRTESKRAVRRVLIAIGLCSLAVCVVLVNIELPNRLSAIRPSSFAFYMAPARAWEFVGGALLALGAFAGRRQLGRWESPLGLAIVLGAALSLHETSRFPGVAALAPVAGTMLMIDGGLTAGPRFRAVFDSRFANRIGDLSFSWYLWHWPLIVYAKTAWPHSSAAALMACLVALSVSAASYRWIEQPFRRSPMRRAPWIFVICCAVSIGAALGSHRIALAIDRVPTIARYLDGHIGHAVNGGCSAGIAVGADPDHCDWGIGSGSQRAVLIGDSNAGHFAEAFFDATAERGMSGYVTWRGNCPFSDVVRIYKDVDPAECRSFYEDSMASMLTDPPDVVVIASSSQGYAQSANFVFVDPATGERATDEREKTALWQSSLASTLKRLNSAGSATVVVHPVLMLPDGEWDWSACSPALVAMFESRCEVRFDSAPLKAMRAPIVIAEQAAASGTLATTIDPASTVCPADECASRRDGSWWYVNRNHITVHAAEALTDEFRAALDRVLGQQQ